MSLYDRSPNAQRDFRVLRHRPQANGRSEKAQP